MAKVKISEFNSNPALNTDIDSINIAEGCSPSGINDAIRELMSQLKDWQSGTSNDPYVVGSSGSLTLNQGTANTVPYLNGSKVVTSGTALSFDGSNLGLGVTPSANSVGKSLDIVGGMGLFSESNNSYLTTNAYYDSGWKYKATDFASYLMQTDGQFRFYNAPSGTAGNAITFTQAMTLNANGNLSLGTTSPSEFSGYITQTINGTNGSFTEYRQNGSNTFRVGSDNSDGGLLYTQAATAIRFGTNATERARIDSSGNLLVGATSFATSNIDATLIAKGYVIVEHVSGTGSGSGYLNFQYAGSTVGSITQSGTTAVAYNTTSDYRLKENVQPLSGALARIAALKPCTYTWKSAPDEIGEGFIAHELAEVCPQAVTGEKDAVNEDGSIKPQSIDTSFLVATLTAAIQEQQAIIESLKARLDAANL